MAFYNQTTCSIRFTRSDYSYAMFREGLWAYAEDYAIGDGLPHRVGLLHTVRACNDG